MDLSGRLVLLKSSAKEEDYATFTSEDVIFLFDDVARPESVILNLSDPSECYVLFPSSAQMEDILNLNLLGWGGSHVPVNKIDIF